VTRPPTPAVSASGLWSAHGSERHGERAVAARGPGRARRAFADLALLNRDLLAEGASAIIGTGARLTVLGGRVVHRSEG